MDALSILLVTPSLPYPPNWGFGMRVYQLARELAARHSVAILCYAEPHSDDYIAALRHEGVKVYTVPPPRPQDQGKRALQLRSLVSLRSFQSSSLSSAAMQGAIDRLLASQRFDVVQVESSQMAGFDFGSRPVVVLDEHNIEYELLYRTFREERSPARKLYNWIEYLKFRREEQHCWNTVDGCVLTSPRENAVVRTRARARPSVVVPNGVDVNYFRPSTAVTEPGSIVFTGLMRYRPNVDGVIFFTRKILPHIVRERPDVTFTIVGMGPPKEVQRLAGPHVRVTGTVPDVRPYAERSEVIVVPLRMGSGTRLKVLDGMAMGKALVSTSLGCEGIAVSNGNNLLIADDPLEFARAVLRVLNDSNLRTRLAQRGRELVEREYSWEAIVPTLERFYAELLESHSGVTSDSPAALSAVRSASTAPQPWANSR